MPFVSEISPNINRAKNESIIPRVFEMALQECCRGDVKLNYSLQFQNQNQAIDMIKNHSIHFIMPIQKDKKSNKYFHNPFISIGTYVRT